MKKTILLFTLVLCLHWVGQSQSISFDYQSESLSTVMNDLDKRYAINFSHGNQTSLLNLTINAKGKQLSLQEGLDEMLRQQPVEYKLIAGQVVMRYKEIKSDVGAIEFTEINEKKEEVITNVELENQAKNVLPARETLDDLEPISSRRPKLFSLKMISDVDDDHDDFHWHFGCRNDDGPGGFEIYTSDIFRYHFSFKTGRNHFYTLMNFSSDRVLPWRYKLSDPQWAFGIGAGYKAKVFRIPFRTELILNHINEDRFISTRLNELIQLRTTLGIPFLGTEITFGPTFNLHVSGVLNDDTDRIGSNLLPGWEEAEINGDKGIFYWIGGSFGVVF